MNEKTGTNKSSRRVGMPGKAPMGVSEKAKDFKGTIGKLVRYIGRYKYGVIAVMIFAIASTIFTIAGPKILAKATNELASGMIAKFSGTGSINFTKIRNIMLLLIVLYLISALFSFMQGIIMTGISQKVCFNLRKQMVEKISRMPMNYFDKKTNGEVLSFITNDVDTLGMSLNQSVTQLITSVTTLLGIFIMMLTISPLLTLLTIIVLPLSIIFMSIIVKKSQKYFKQQQDYLGHVNGQVEEVFGGHTIVKLFDKEESVVREFEDTNRVLYESAWKSQFLSGMMQPIMGFIGNLGYVVVVIGGGFLAINGTIQIGDIQAFIQYVRNFTQPISQIAQVSNMLQSMAAAAERVFEFLDEEEEEQTASAHASVKIDECAGNVEFEHVYFGYNPNKIIINDFSASIKQGQKIAIVGPTGAGKTTMVKLLLRFYDLNSGTIKIDGHDIAAFDREELHSAFGMVLQDTWLFKGTIMENIRYGRLDATDEEVIAAAKAAHAHRFIKTLPGGYNMELNEEISNISQGQKQLLTIARAILADNKIMILDEATSSVDTRTEERIQKAMDNLMKGRTSFIIAHRLSTIKNADLILVLKDGDIVEQGSHEELMKQQGFYADLYNSQFENSESKSDEKALA